MIIYASTSQSYSNTYVIQGNARAQPLADTVSGIRLGGLHRPASSGWCQSERNHSMSRLGR